MATVNTNNGNATLSLVLALIGICFLPAAIGGLIFGMVGMSQVKRTGQVGGGVARAGTIISLIILGLWLLVISLILSGGN